jgi:hypothetical protein
VLVALILMFGHVRIDVLTMAEGSTDFARNLAGENGGQYATVP